MDLLIKNALLRGNKKKVDIFISDGRFSKIEENIRNKADEIIDAEGNLVTPTFVNPHLHIDKAYTGLNGRSSSEETLEESIKIMHEFKRNYTPEEVKKRAVRAIKDSVKYGVTKIRANVDIDTICGLTALEGCLLAKEDTRDIADVQLVAFPQEGIFRDKGTEELMYKAMEAGADVVGGMPAAEWIAEKAKEHVDLVFKIAEKYNADIDMHMDQTKDPFAQAMEYTALRSIEQGYQRRVTGGHCTSLAYQNDSHAAKVIELLKLAEFNVCVNPQVLAIMGVDREPRTRGITRVRELVAAGVNVATAQDTICDGFHIYGTGDPLDYGLLMAYQAQYNSTSTAGIIYDMLTYNAAKIMHLNNYGIKEGNPADFNIVYAERESEALRRRASRLVFRAGKLIAKYSNDGELV
ncbi:MAG: amidohydrolase family protein [Spirochaetales bacterium]|nr:amidohydrolase family protein [Spirochaetales bacterium]